MTPGTPVTIEYYVTERAWRRPVLDQLMLFSPQHYAEQVCKGGQPKKLEQLFRSAS